MCRVPKKVIFGSSGFIKNLRPKCQLALGPLCWSIPQLWGIIIILLGLFVDSRVSGDCPTLCECKWKSGKESVHCRRAGLTEIPLNLDSATQVLDLSGNLLSRLPDRIFLQRNLLNLQKIYLSECEIMMIEVSSFVKLTNLVELDLSSNLLNFVPSLSFKSIPELRDLKLSFNPLSRLTNDAFIHLPRLVRLDLNGCRIGTIEPWAFRGLSTLEWLRLDGNRLFTVEAVSFFPLGGLHGLELSGNPWNCTCTLQPLIKWMTKFNVPFGIPPRCENPRRLGGKSWEILELEDFSCLPKVLPTQETKRAHEGENVTFQCKFRATPDTQVRWLNGANNKDFLSPLGVMNGTFGLTNFVITESFVWPEPKTSTIFGRNTISSSRNSSTHLGGGSGVDDKSLGDKISELTLISVETPGTFICQAENRGGVATTNFSLQVHQVKAEHNGKDLYKGALIVALGLLTTCLFLVCILLLSKRRFSLTTMVPSNGPHLLVPNSNNTSSGATTTTMNTMTHHEEKIEMNHLGGGGGGGEKRQNGSGPPHHHINTNGIGCRGNIVIENNVPPPRPRLPPGSLGTASNNGCIGLVTSSISSNSNFKSKSSSRSSKLNLEYQALPTCELDDGDGNDNEYSDGDNRPVVIVGNESDRANNTNINEKLSVSGSNNKTAPSEVTMINCSDRETDLKDFEHPTATTTITGIGRVKTLCDSHLTQFEPSPPSSKINSNHLAQVQESRIIDSYHRPSGSGSFVSPGPGSEMNYLYEGLKYPDVIGNKLSPVNNTNINPAVPTNTNANTSITTRTTLGGSCSSEEVSQHPSSYFKSLPRLNKKQSQFIAGGLANNFLFAQQNRRLNSESQSPLLQSTSFERMSIRSNQSSYGDMSQSCYASVDNPSTSSSLFRHHYRHSHSHHGLSGHSRLSMPTSPVRADCESRAFGSSNLENSSSYAQQLEAFIEQYELLQRELAQLTSTHHSVRRGRSDEQNQPQLQRQPKSILKNPQRQPENDSLNNTLDNSFDYQV